MGTLDFWGGISPLGINLPPKHVFRCRERPANPYRVSWRSVQGTKKEKKHAWGEHFTPPPNDHPFTYTFLFVHVWWGHRHNHPCQVSSQSVQQFRLPRGSKFTISHRFGELLLQQCYALTCYTVITCILPGLHIGSAPSPHVCHAHRPSINKRSRLTERT